MADLKFAVVGTFVDRITGPATAAVRAMGGFALGGKAIAESAGLAGAATDKASVAQTGLAKTAEAATAGATALATAAQTAGLGTAGLGQAATSSAEAMNVLRMATDGVASSDERMGRSVERTGEQVERAARRMTMLERSQRMVARATVNLKTHSDELNASLAKLAYANIASEGLGRAGRAINTPLEGSVARQAEFERGLTGIGILADMPQSQTVAVGQNIIDQAQRFALPINTILQDDMAVLNEGVYRGLDQLKAASRSAASLSLLADIGGAPVSGPEAGALISTYAHAMSVPADQLDRYNAILFRGSQLGGDKIGDVARFMPVVMAQMKGRAFGNEQGFIDAVAAFQIVKRVAGTDEAAGVDLQDLMANLSHRLTKKRFEKAAHVNLDDAIAAGEKQGKSPLQTVIDILRKKVGDDPNDPKMAGKLGEFFNNQQAAQAAMALLQYTRDGSQGIGFDTLRKQLVAPDVGANYQAAIRRASTGSFADRQRQENAKDAAGIATGTALKPVTSDVSKVQQGFFGQLTAFMKGPAGGVGATALAGLGAVAGAAGGVGSFITGVIGPMLIFKSLTKSLLPDVAELFGGRALGMAAGVLEPVGGAAAAAAGGLAVVGEAIGGIIAAIAAATGLSVGWVVVAVVAAIVAAIGTWIAVGWFLVKNWTAVQKALLGDPRALTAVFGGYFNAGRDLIGGFIKGAQSKAGELMAAIGGIASRAIDAFKQRLGIHSPSLVFHLLGEQTMQGLAGGLTAGGRDPVARVGRIAAQITAAMAVGASTAAMPAVAETTAHGAHPSLGAAHIGPVPAGKTVHVQVTQHFHLKGETDVRKLAREIHRQSGEGMRAALHDGADEE